MKTRVATAVERLKEAEDIEGLVELENEIAAMVGKGFLRGDFDYAYFMQIKQDVEHIETERRKQFEEKIPLQPKRTTPMR